MSDQITKSIARDVLSSRPLRFFGDVLRLQHAENSGAFLSLGSEMPMTIALSLIVGGGIGNLVDRATIGDLSQPRDDTQGAGNSG